MNRAPVFACPAQRGSLLDAEAMLLVDDDESQVRETHALLEESVGSHNDERLCRVHRAVNLAAGGWRRRARQQANVRGVHPQGRQERPQGGGVLLRQDLGRRNERTLVTGSDHLEQRAEGDDCLARSHVSLQEPLHRHLAGQVGPDLGDGLALGVRELKRQRLPETLAQWRVDRRGQCRHGPHAPTLRGQPHLEDEGLGEGQGLAGLLIVLIRLGLVQGAQALGVGSKASALADIGGNRVGHIGIVQVVQHHADCTGDRPRGQRSGRRVDRDGARGDALNVLPVHTLEGGMGELQLAAVGPDLAGEEERLPRRQQTLDGGELVLVLREEGRRQELNAVGEGDFQAHARAGSVGDQVCSGNLGKDRHVLTFAQGGQRREAAPVVVAARRDQQQVANRRHTRPLEGLRRLFRQAQGQRNVECAHEAHPATRLGPLCPPSQVSRSIVEEASRVESSWRTVATV